MGPIAEQVMDFGIVALVSIGGTYLGIARMMQKRYQTLIQSEVERVAQIKLHEIVDARLDNMKRRILFLNLLASKLCQASNIEDKIVDSLRKTCELNEHELRG